MKKRIFIVISFVCCLCFVFFWEALVGNFILAAANKYCLYRFGAPLQTDGIRKESGEWIIEHPQIVRKDVHLWGEAINLKFALLPFKREAAIEMRIPRSRIEIGREAADLISVFKDLIPKSFGYWFLNIKSRFDIDDGVVTWEDPERGIESAFFQLFSASGEERKEAKMALCLGKEKEPFPLRNYFQFQLLKEEATPLQATLSFSRVEAGKISRGLEALGHPLEGWEVLAGEIDGSLELFFPDEAPPFAIGKAAVTGLTFEHPQTQALGKIEESVLDIKIEHEKKILIGRLEIVQGASLSFQRDGRPFWSVNDLKGGIYFQPELKAFINLCGGCEHNGEEFDLTILGEAQLLGKHEALLDLAFALSSPHKKEGASARFHARQLGRERHAAEISLENVGPGEWKFIQEAISRYAPKWERFTVREGRLHASGIAVMQGLRLEALKIEQIATQHLDVSFEPLGFVCQIDRTSGNFSVNFLEENPWETIEADCTIFRASFMAADYAGMPLSFEDIHTNLMIKRGVIQKSEMKGKFAGLEGTIVVDWQSKEEPFKLSFSGLAGNMAPFLPQSLRERLLNAFSNDRLWLTAGVAWEQGEARVKGEFQLSNEQFSHSKETIEFGFHLEKCSEKLWNRWPADPLALSYWKNVGYEVLQTVLPPLASPAALFVSNWIKAEGGIGGLVLRKGWFSASSLPLDKYLAPLIFSRQQMELRGVGSFRGHFDHSQLAVEYNGKEVSLESPYLKISAATVGQLPENSGTEVAALHYFDFDKGTHFGSIGVKGARYLEKKTGVTFKDIDASILFEGRKIHISPIETRCNGMALSGEIDIDFELPEDGKFEVVIHAQRVKGNVEKLRELCARFNPELFLLQIPLNGRLDLGEKGGTVRCSFSPEGCTVKALVKGSVEGGSLALESLGLVLKDLRFRFNYQHENGSFELGNVQAFLPSLEGAYPDGLLLAADHVRLDDFWQNRGSFDIWISDRSRDLIRLVGAAQEDNGLIAVRLDSELSHLGEIHPSGFRLLLKNWLEVEEFQLNLNLELSSLLSEIKLYGQTRMGTWMKSFMREVEAIRKAHGLVRVDLNYKGLGEEWTYHLLGEDVSFGNQKLNSFDLLGNKIGNLWTIERLALDERVIEAKLVQGKENWEVKDLAFQSGSALRVRLEGKLWEKESRLDARVHQIEVDLSQLKGSFEIEQFVARCYPHGILRGSGELKFEWGKEHTPWRAEAILDTSLLSWDLRGIHFQDVKSVSCHFISDRGLTFRKLDSAMIDSQAKNVFANIQVEKMQYEFASGELSFDELRFQVHAHHLPRFADQLRKSFPGFVAPAIAEAISNAKMEGRVEGTLTYELNPPFSALRLALKDGRYHFLNSEHDISQFVLEYDPFEFKVVSRYLLANRAVWLTVRSSSPTLAEGDLVITDTPLDQSLQSRAHEALYVKWENDSRYGFSILNVEGNYQGMTFQLDRDAGQPLTQEAMFLTGTIGVDARRARGFFPKEMGEALLNLRAGDGYRLKGKWKIKKDNTAEDYSDNMHFAGTLEGEHFCFKGYQFDSLAAHLEYTPAAVRVRDLTVRDLCGELRADTIDLIRTEGGKWVFMMPSLNVSKFSPSLMQEVGMPRSSIRKPLIVTEMTLEGSQGSLSDSVTIKGGGHLRFTNRSKKRLQNILFQIPADLLSRIGLDLSVLTPVTGTIHYQIKEGKILLTKFKEIYSEGKLSKFYLPNSGSPSYVKFDGTLNVQVKMRQYNLLFKLAELFTVNIQGDLIKPVYSLQKQQGEAAVAW